MQEEILLEYEKIKDKLSEEEFLNEINKIKEDNEFMDDFGAAQVVVQNFSGDDTSMISQSDEVSSEMTDEIREKYEKVKDKLSEEEFLSRMNELRENEDSNPFMNDAGLADMVVGEHVTEEVEVISEKPEYAVDTIDKLEEGSKDVNISGRVISISNPKSFKTRKGVEGQVCNVELKDNTGQIRAVFWTQNIKLLKNVSEGDVIQIKGVDIKDGFSGLEANLRQRSTLVHLEDDPSKFPVYEETITNITDIEPDTKVNIIARIKRTSSIRSYEKNGKEGKVSSIDLTDATGQITYTLWNKNAELINELELEDGDTVKILQAQARERTTRDGNSEISLTHWDGRIIKGDFDVPEIQIEFTDIADVCEKRDVSIKGIVSRLQDIKTFTRKTDNTEGKLRNFDVRDPTGEIRVTVWGDDTDKQINKGDIIKIIGGDVRFDEYTQSQYSMNTNFNTQITINPNNLPIEELDQLNALKEELRPTPIGEIEAIEEDGIEVDIIGRIISVNDVNEFQRDDGNVGLVRSVVFADETGKVQLSFWNEKASEEYVVGDAYQIENARTRIGMYSIDLNIGGGARILKLTEEQASAMFIPELSTLEKNLYEYKKIEDLDEDMQDIIVVGRVIELSEIREFERDTGDPGFVKNIEIADDTGSVRVVLWDNDAKRDLELGQPIKFQNPRLSIDVDNRIQATVSRGTTILEPSENEINELPTYEELKEAIFVSKNIESLYEDDTNVCVKAEISEVNTQRVLMKKCPHCRENIDESEDENVCENCGHTFDEPYYLFMIPTRISDDTGDISVTFFDNLAEQLIGMKKEDIISDLEEGLGIEEKIEDLVGTTIEIIANVSFDEYREENKLNPKKILSIN